MQEEIEGMLMWCPVCQENVVPVTEVEDSLPAVDEFIRGERPGKYIVYHCSECGEYLGKMRRR